MKKSCPISEASKTDVPDIISLLNQCFLQADDIPAEKQIFWVVRKDRQLLGVICIENYKPFGLLRSFAVHPSFRKQAIGANLLYHAVAQAEKMGIESLYLCTDTAARYFEAHKWVYINRDSVHEKVQQSEEFRAAWSETTACMFLPVKDGIVKTAVKEFQAGFNCAQSVFSAFAPTLGVSTKEALKITSGFGAGICYKGEICGAVSGAYMAIGLKYGRWRSEDNDAREKTYALMRDFDRQFITRNGSLYCNKLLDGDMSSPEERKKINDARKFQTHCPRFVKDAAEITERLITP
ncbi:MAG: GNAT family N-acetyltransferase [Bacteroidales bacterium]|nr:GNAT family N-acetyltransferase [Bacteroidales bacterium]